MNQDSIRQCARRQPFQPFRLKMTDGTFCEIRHPDMALAGRHEAVLLVPRRKTSAIPDQPFFVSYFRIMEIEPLPSDKPPSDSEANGQQES